MVIPTDVDDTRIFWEARGDGKGTCGACAVAVAAKRTVSEVIDAWTGGYKGTATVGQVKQELQKYGFTPKGRHSRDPNRLAMPDGYTEALAFIQWSEYTHWRRAYKRTHWVYLEMLDGTLHVFCNSRKEFCDGSETFRTLLNGGSVRSYVGLKKAKGSVL